MQVFLKYFHPDELYRLVRSRQAKVAFVEKRLRGYIARYRYRFIKAKMLEQNAAVTKALTFMEVGIPVSSHCEFPLLTFPI